MRNIRLKKVVSALIILAIIINLFAAPLYAEPSKLSREDVRKAAQKTIDYYYNTLKKNEFAGVLDWPALGLFGFGEDISGPKWTANGKNGAYWREQEVKEGIGLTKVKNTDFQRTIIGICSAGRDPRSFGGMDFVKIVKDTMLPNGHFADSVEDRKTGKPVGEDLVNAHIFGIIALHCAGEPIPNRDKCLEWLEKQQHKDGGFTWDVKSFEDPADYDLITSDIDMTAGAVMAFAILGEDESNLVVKKALDFLKKNQNEYGGFYSWGTDNPESCAWVIQALTLIGQDPMGSEWTKPSGVNPVAAMLRFQLKNGSFSHTLTEGENLPIYDSGISTYEALYGLADAYNKKAAYDMLFEKYKPRAQEKLFSDFKPGQFGFDETMELIYDYVLSGYSDGSFKPENPVARDELSKYIVYGLGLKGELDKFKGSDRFKDVKPEHWANACIGVCADKGYIGGSSENAYSPSDKITGEQLMAILIRAAGLEKEASELKGESSDWSEGYIKAAEKHGLIYPGFDRKKPASRAQCSWCIVKLRSILKK